MKNEEEGFFGYTSTNTYDSITLNKFIMKSFLNMWQ